MSAPAGSADIRSFFGAKAAAKPASAPSQVQGAKPAAAQVAAKPSNIVDLDDDEEDIVIGQVKKAKVADGSAKTVPVKTASPAKRSPAKPHASASASRTGSAAVSVIINSSVKQGPPSASRMAVVDSFASTSSSIPAGSSSRAPPLAPLSFGWMPMGGPACLEGETIVVTGELEHLKRDAMKAVVEKHGGRVTSGVSGKTTMLLHGSVLEDGRRAQEGSKWREATGEVEKVKAGTRKDVPMRILSETAFYELLEASLPAEQRAAAKAAREAATTASATAGIELAASATATTAGHVDSQLWADKYKPKALPELVGNIAGIKALDEWLASWQAVHITHTAPKPKWSRENPGARAALISGPPGIGKTTTAVLLARRHGYDVMELNASDSRAAKDVKAGLGEAVGSQVLQWGPLAMRSGSGSGAGGSSSSSSAAAASDKKRLIVMDEVDGMSSGDRGGNAELIKCIKMSKVPIICICNDRQSPKIKSLANSCYDVKFMPPTKEQTAARVARIAQAEGLIVEQPTVESLVESCGGDIRQVLNSLQMWAVRSKHMTAAELKARMGSMSKDGMLRLDAFSATPRMFIEGRSAPLETRLDLFYVDYDWVPLLVAQQYAEAISRTPLMDGGMSQLDRLVKAADCVTVGDVYSDYIRNRQAWGLLPSMAVANVRACTYATCINPGMVMFPAWLGKNSSRNKKARLLAELGLHMAEYVSGGREAIRLDYCDSLRITLVTPLISPTAVENSAEAAKACISLLDEYGLSNTDLMETLLSEVRFPPGPLGLTSDAGSMPDFEKLVPPTVKAALTREWKKGSHKSMALAMSVPAGLVSAIGRGKKGSGGGGAGGVRVSVDGEEVEDEGEEEGQEDDGEEGEDGEGKPAAVAPAAAAKRGGASASGRGSRGGSGGGPGSRGGRGGGKARGGAAAAGGAAKGAARGGKAGAKRKRDEEEGDESEADSGISDDDDE